MDGHAIIKIGEKIHLMVRRNFETDLRRHLVGIVTDANKTVIRVDGNVFVFDVATN